MSRAVSPAPHTRFDRRLLAPMVLGSILNPINSSIIAVALVPIASAFGAAASETAWLVSALYLATSVGQPLAGRLVDSLGPRRVFLVGTGLTGLAGIAGMLAPTLGVLIAARVVLGLGTCAGYPSSMYLIRREAERTGEDNPTGVLTVLAVANQTIAVIGPTLGGLLVGVWGWRATFAVNVPLSIACVVLGALFLPRASSARPGTDETGTPSTGAGRSLPWFARFDVLGILSFTATLVALLLFLMDMRLETLWLLLAAIVGGGCFAVRELRAASPFIDVRVFAGNVPLIATYLRAILSALVMYALLYGFTQWLESGYGLSPSGAGLVLLPTFAAAIVVSSTTGRLREIAWKLRIGAILQLAAGILLLFAGGSSPLWYLVGIAVLSGVPQGLLGLGNQNALYVQADADKVGASAGLLRTFSYVGAILASAASGAFFGEHADTAGLHELAWLMVCASAALVLLTVFDRSLARVRPRGRPASP